MLSPLQLTHACLARVARIDPALNSFITVTAEQALADARLAEAELSAGHWRGPLHGIPIALKDNIDTGGVRTTAGSEVFVERIPGEDAEVVQRLKAAGAVILGKLNLHEFSGGTTSAISHFGSVHNPWDPARTAGGSSGGSAAAVAASLCFGAVGTDTGGSIRIPAACCGIVGFKPSFGVVSSRGVVPVSTSFDHVGPLCRSVADAILMLRAMTDHPLVAALEPEALPPVSRLRIGVFHAPGSLCDAPIEAEVQAALDAALGVLRSLVAEVREAELPMPEQLGRLIDAEAYAFHAPTLAQMPERYDPRTRDMLLAGRDIPIAEEARLRGDLARHRAAIHEAFAKVDLVVLPTLPGLPLPLAEAREPFALNACTFAFSLGGLPSISLPCGFSRSGLPIGLQIGGPPLADARVLALAQAYEQATDWHRRRPTL
ncbi:amidase [Rivibacter subsaxonicus]|uniref:amidase n=1 Tax=Rivibacter subsaxonicus TaxID=457575 RepID=UPI0013EE9943|nr:amidase [Rivibacter subsaxonicus]